ncbi:hypothetical protein X907_0823 [Glycocaulis alkaliphilus]|uniref:Uncharacterized protein n=1 Tax=Glycocaulis alkaliphilus TaxID=1434191 RepID=A0A3T0E813_9PROT|nr:hypothetical protein X907_0823 [Glycocaulis alkaliphilus]
MICMEFLSERHIPGTVSGKPGAPSRRRAAELREFGWL